MVLSPFWHGLIMDIIDERILSVLKGGKPKPFIDLLSEAGFSHNTLKLHIKKLLSEGVLVRQKVVSPGLGRPKFVYDVSPKAKTQVSAALLDSSIELVHLPFSRLKHLCRFEKGGFCKETRIGCNSRNCPQIPKSPNKNHF
jgi:DNA-binding Lrp family transcriptional regulator